MTALASSPDLRLDREIEEAQVALLGPARPGSRLTRAYYKGYDPATDRRCMVTITRRERDEKAARYGERLLYVDLMPGLPMERGRMGTRMALRHLQKDVRVRKGNRELFISIDDAIRDQRDELRLLVDGGLGAARFARGSQEAVCQGMGAVAIADEAMEKQLHKMAKAARPKPDKKKAIHERGLHDGACVYKGEDRDTGGDLLRCEYGGAEDSSDENEASSWVATFVFRNGEPLKAASVEFRYGHE